MKNRKCNFCDKTEGLEYHHIIPQSLGGTDDIFNLLLVCNDHHAILHEMRARSNISALTKEGLRKAKERGVKLGGTEDGRNKGREKAVATIKEMADNFATDIRNIIQPLLDADYSINKIADYLNDNKVETTRGGKWHPTTVANLIRRYQAISGDSSHIELHE